MSEDPMRAYCFATKAQWSVCLFAGADRSSVSSQTGLQPFARYDPRWHLVATPDAAAPAATRTGEVLWCAERGTLHRLAIGEEHPIGVSAPAAVTNAHRLVASSSGLWVASTDAGALHCFEEDTLTRRFIVEIPHARVVDIADDGRGGILALIERNQWMQCVRIDCAGRLINTVTLEGVSRAIAFAFLRRFERLVVLGSEGARLLWFPLAGGAAVLTVVTAAIRPCFHAEELGGDSRGRVFVGGRDGKDDKAAVVIFDGDGNRLGDIPVSARVTGLAGTRDALLVTTRKGLHLFGMANRVPDASAQVQCSLITPVLCSPDRADARRWLRVEALASLPAGTTMEIVGAATDDIAIRDRLIRVAGDESRPASERMERLRSETDRWQRLAVFQGSEAHATMSDVPFAAPLFDVHERYLWIGVTLIAAAGATLPALSTLAVLYPGRTLMEHLPSVYQRAEADARHFLRSLVGVLETTTQALDTRISAMGSHVHPASASAEWLDYLARWLGLPWDDGLDPKQKRCLVQNAAAIAKGRGTRAGLETLLACLLPGTPIRFRVTDATADYGFATIGDDDCHGSSLPTVLAGLPVSAAELGAKAVLGSMRLPCQGQVTDGVTQIAGEIRIDVAATADERRRWEPWLAALIGEMVPVMTRVRLRWVIAQSLSGDQLDDELRLGTASMPHLGTDAVTGWAHLPERGTTLSISGADLDSRLQ